MTRAYDEAISKSASMTRAYDETISKSASMTHAYDEVLLERAADSLGRMLDFSVHSLRQDAASMMELFCACGLASLFERGDIRTIAGMSGIELAYETMERSGLTYERTTPRHTRSLSGEYWCGRVLVRAQWASCLRSGSY